MRWTRQALNSYTWLCFGSALVWWTPGMKRVERSGCQMNKAKTTFRLSRQSLSMFAYHPNRGPFCAKTKGPDSVVIDTGGKTIKVMPRESAILVCSAIAQEKLDNARPAARES
jgi:hypothetical protein